VLGLKANAATRRASDCQWAASMKAQEEAGKERRRPCARETPKEENRAPTKTLIAESKATISCREAEAGCTIEQALHLGFLGGLFSAARPFAKRTQANEAVA